MTWMPANSYWFVSTINTAGWTAQQVLLPVTNERLTMDQVRVQGGATTLVTSANFDLVLGHNENCSQ